MTYTEINRRLEERAFQIWYRVALDARENPVSAHEFDLIRRLASQVSPSQLFVGRNLALALSEVTGGGVESITTILDWERELRSSCFNDRNAWEAWCETTGEIYGAPSKGTSILPESFSQSMPSAFIVSSTLNANPWAMVFLVFAKLTASIFQTPKDVTVTFKRFNRLPAEEE